MNLELPFTDASAALDESLAEIDRALDVLFLGEVEVELERLRAERADDGDQAVA